MINSTHNQVHANFSQIHRSSKETIGIKNRTCNDLNNNNSNKVTSINFVTHLRGGEMLRKSYPRLHRKWKGQKRSNQDNVVYGRSLI